MRSTGAETDFQHVFASDSSRTDAGDADASVAGSMAAIGSPGPEILDAKVTRLEATEVTTTTSSTRAPKLTVETWHGSIGGSCSSDGRQGRSSGVAACQDDASELVVVEMAPAAPVVLLNRRVEDVYDVQTQNIGRYCRIR